MKPVLKIPILVGKYISIAYWDLSTKFILNYVEYLNLAPSIEMTSIEPHPTYNKSSKQGLVTHIMVFITF